MQLISRLLFVPLILIQFLTVGCAKPPLPQIGAFIDVHGSPHIVQEGVCYYIGFWGPGSTVLKIYYKGSSKPDKSGLPGFSYREGGLYYQQVTSIEWEYIEEDKLHFYIPLLIESLKDTEPGNKGMKALSRLYNIVGIAFPNGYGDYYMHPTENVYTGTPFEEIGNMTTLDQSLFPDVKETTYKAWKHWWDTDGHTAFPKDTPHFLKRSNP